MNNYVLMKDENVKNMFTNPITGKRYSAKVIANTLGMDEEEVYNNIEYIHPKTGISQTVVDSETDVSYDLDDKIYITIEFNRNYKGKYTQVKNEAYILALYLRQIPKSKYYTKLKPIIQINIDAYDYFGKNKFLYHSMLMETDLHLIESENIQIYHINLDYLRNICYNKLTKENKLEELLYILVCNNKEELDKLYRSDKFMNEVKDEIERKIEAIDSFLYYNKEELERLDYEAAKQDGYNDGYNEGIEQGLEQGIEQGIEQGTYRNKIEIAKNLLTMNLTLEQISQATNLSKKEIESLSTSK